jgi:hypothetical protein
MRQIESICWNIGKVRYPGRPQLTARQPPEASRAALAGPRSQQAEQPQRHLEGSQTVKTVKTSKQKHETTGCKQKTVLKNFKRVWERETDDYFLYFHYIFLSILMGGHEQFLQMMERYCLFRLH